MAMAMPMVASTYFGVKPIAIRPLIKCSMPSRTGTIKVIVNGAGKEIGRAAIAAISKARGMELAGAIDPLIVGRDAGEIANLDEPLEVPVLNDLVMLLTSLSQSRNAGVLVDFSEPSSVYDNVRQATAFGMRSVVHVPGVDMDVIASLSKFCEKASMGCIISPTLSIGSLLLEKAAMTAAYHYNHVEIVESRPDTSVCLSPDTVQLANNLSGLGQTYNKNDLSTDCVARGAVVGDGVRVHSMALPGLCSSMEVHFSAPGEVLSIKHDITNLQSLMPGLLLAIRRVVRLKLKFFCSPWSMDWRSSCEKGDLYLQINTLQQFYNIGANGSVLFQMFEHPNFCGLDKIQSMYLSVNV